MPLTERDVNIPHNIKTHTPSTQKTPQSQSKLPRRVPTPTSTPSAAQWSAHVADRTARTDKATSESRKRSDHKRGIAPIRPSLRVCMLVHEAVVVYSDMRTDTEECSAGNRQASATGKAIAPPPCGATFVFAQSKQRQSHLD